MPVDPGPGYSTPRKRRPSPKPAVAPTWGISRLVPQERDPITTAVEATKPEGVAKVNAARTETLRRQRLLVAQGYQLTIDGIWGVRSQSAWTDYQRRRREKGTLGLGAGPLKRDPKGRPVVVDDERVGFEVAVDEAIVRSRKEKEELAERAAIEQRVVERKKLLGQASTLRKNPSSARAYKFRDLAMVLLDKETKLGVQTNAGARIFQEWAVANGMKGVKVTGKYDVQTHTALQKAYKFEVEKEKRKSIRAIQRDLYAPTGVKAGDKVDWLPYGRVPSAPELYKMIQRDDFQAHAILNALMQRSITNGSTFDPIRRSELMMRAIELQPFLRVGRPAWMRAGSGQGEMGNQLSYIAAILGTQILAPTSDVNADDLAKYTGMSRDEIEDDLRKNPEWRADNEKRVLRIRAELHALTSSSNAEEFKTKLARQLQLDEIAFTEFQKKMAGEKSSWWGKAIERWMVPGEKASEFGVFAAHTIDHYQEKYIAKGVIRNDKGEWFSPRYEEVTREHAPTWEDAEAYFGRAGEDYDGQYEKARAADRIALELILDPLNFVAPLKYTSTAAKGVAAGAALALGKKGLAAGKFGGYVMEGGKLVYKKGDITLGGSIKSGVHSLDVLGIHDSAIFERAARMGRKATMLKVDAVAGARVRVDRMAKHGFKAPKPFKNGKGETVDHGVKVREPRSKKTRELIASGRETVRTWLTTDDEFSELVNVLEQEAQSLFVNFDRGQLSNVGASMRANLIEKYRVTTLHQVATKHTWEQFDQRIAEARIEFNKKHPPAKRLSQEEYDALSLDEQVKRSEAAAIENKAWKLVERDIARQQYEEYNRIVQGGGTFLKGGFLTKGGFAGEGIDKVVYQKVESAMKHRMDELDKGIIPALQDHLEEAAETAGRKLWDDNRLWAGRNGEGAETVRRIGRESFDEANLKSAPNPQHNIAFTRAERDDLVEAELRRRESRIWQKAERDAAMEVGGKITDDKWILGALERERGEILEAWVKRGGQYYDTREEVLVSDLYARHLKAAYATDDATGMAIWRGREGTIQADEWVEKLAALADAPGLVDGGTMDNALWKLAWNQGGMHRRRLPGGMSRMQEPPTRRFLGPDFTGIKPNTPEWDDKMREAKEAIEWGDKLRDGLDKNAIGIRRAWDETISGELRSDTAFWQALAQSQTWYAKTIYRTLSATLNTWTFATLALRPGWMVRNVIDNIAKLIVVGVRDPRMFFLGGAKPGAMVASVFDMGLVEIRNMVFFLDRLLGTHGTRLEATKQWLALEDMIWTLSTDALKAIFSAHNIDVPESVLDEAKLDVFDRRMLNAFRPSVDENSATARGLMKPQGQLSKANEFRADKWKSFRDHSFELMGNRPENYFKRVLYRSEFQDEMKRLMAMRNSPYRNAPSNKSFQPTTGSWIAGQENPRLRVNTGGEFGLGQRMPRASEPVEFTWDEAALARVAESMGLPADTRYMISIAPKADFNMADNITEPIAGVYSPNTKRVNLWITHEGLRAVRSQEELDKFLLRAIFVFTHEARHGVQFKSAKSLARAVKLNEIVEKAYHNGIFGVKLPYSVMNKVYRFQPHELDANFTAYRKARQAGDLLRASDAKGNDLMMPGEWDIDGLEQAAHTKAWKLVEDTLFDYSKISVIEDNFRIFFPFIQFWRKNTAFWAKQFVSKPWLPLTVVKLDDERRDSHADLPHWMRRYMHSEEIADAAAFIPGLDVIVKHMIPGDTQYDPFNLLSFAPLYRSLPAIMDELGAVVGMEKGLAGRLKTENQSLPGEKEGWAVFGPMIDAMSDFGLGMSPFARKPLESAGIASERAWQFMFPQTALAVAFTRKFWGDSAALNVAGWESVWGHMPLGVSSDAIADNFDYYVQQFVAEQVARGEEPDFAAAEKAVRHWFLTQNLFAYFSGMYVRRARPEDITLAKLAEVPHDEVPENMREALKLWRMRGHDRLTFERYVQLSPMIEAYYRSADWQTKVRLKREYPEIVQYVDATWRGRPWSGKWTVNAQKYTQTAKFYEALRVVEAVEAEGAVKDAALETFKTPELEAYWNGNGTPKQERDTMIRAAVWEYHSDLQNGYFEIDEDDFAARDDYLREHPELVRHWNRNNDPADDFEAIIGGANAALRSQYFAIVKENGGGDKGFAAAAPLLRAFPFMFEDTKSASKVTPDGEWKIGENADWSDERKRDFRAAQKHLSWFFDVYMKKVGEKAAWEWLNGATTPEAKLIRDYLSKYSKGNANWSAEHRAAFLNAKPHLTWFFDVFMKQVGKDKAWAWLEESDTEKAKIIKDYLGKWGKKSKKAIDYLKAKPWLKVFFDLPDDEKNKWLDGNSEGAKIVRDYFAKYANKKGGTAHARAYLKVKGSLDRYFKMSKSERNAWLHSGTPEAKAVLEYFKTYSKAHKFERTFLKKYPSLKGGTPEQRKRLEFWRHYFSLTPDKRPAFILAEAEAHGIFMYGELGEEARHDREMEYKRRAVGLGASDKQSAYLYVKPLLDFYYGLPKSERALFARLNPEINEYLDKYAETKLTGNKALDASIEGYFKLPPDSFARSEYLRTHPKVQAWFNSKSTPAEAAMRNLLEQYFALGTREREEFAVKHPEIDAYFEQRRDQRSLEGDIYDAFDHSDPRLTPFFKDADDLMRAAEAMRRKLKASALARLAPDTIETRRDRRSEPQPYL